MAQVAHVPYLARSPTPPHLLKLRAVGRVAAVELVGVGAAMVAVAAAASSSAAAVAAVAVVVLAGAATAPHSVSLEATSPWKS